MDEAFTRGVLNALYRNRSRAVCPGCGFPMPVYPGRYPSGCPGCGEPRLKDAGGPGSATDREPAAHLNGKTRVGAGAGREA